MSIPEVGLTNSEALHSDRMVRPKAASINLDFLFRPGSAARRIAERLMTGKPQTRYELVDGLGTSVTTVNRVVPQLEKAGAIVTREIGSDGRQAVFRVVDVTGQKRLARTCTWVTKSGWWPPACQETTCSSTWQSISTPTAA